MIVKRFLVILALAVAIVGSYMPRAGTAAEATSLAAAAQFIEEMGQQALGALNGDGGTLEQREEQVRALLRDGLALELLGRFVLGKAWRKASPGERAEYQRLFGEYLTHTYARRIASYKGETFTITDTKPIAETDAIVLTAIARPNGPPLNAGWRVRNIEGSHKIVDVVVEGVSMAVTQRQEFASITAKDGVEGLIEALRSHLDKFGASNALTQAKAN